jgi:hypothetical protein
MIANTPRLSGIRTKGATYAANLPMIRVAYSKSGRVGETLDAQPIGATITVAETGGSGSKLRVTITETVRDINNNDSTVVTNIDGATVLTLKGLVAALNKVAGITAWVTDAPHAFSVDSDDFVALSATAIPEAPSYLDCLKREVATSNPVYLRLGEPTERDNGYMKWLGAEVAITSATAGSVEVGTDDGIAAYQKHYNQALSATANTRYLSYKPDEAPTIKGALLVTVAATSLAGATLTVNTQTANY